MNEPIWLNQGHNFWDQTLLKDLLSEVKSERQIVVVPGPINEVDEVSMELEQFDKVLVIVTSDEEGKFPIDELYHKDMVIFATYYNPKFKNVDHWLPIGYARHTDSALPEKTLDWFFSGQITHKSRYELEEILVNAHIPNGELHVSKGFGQGLDHDTYDTYIKQAKVAPAPQGNVNDDSFRLYEALEVGTVPIPEHRDFWIGLFNEEPPFPILEDYKDLEGYIRDAIYRYPSLNNKCQAWWQRKKREMIWMLSQS